ncbi:MAG: DUF3618 domain-containing protein [Solirubrobacteraceae bacterium]
MSDTPEDRTAAADDAQSKSPEEIRAEIEQTRGQLGDTVEALTAKTDVKAQAQDRISAIKQGVTENVAAAKETVTGKTDEFSGKVREATPESAGAGAQQLTSTIREKPLPFAVAGAFFAGLTIGRLLGRR